MVAVCENGRVFVWGEQGLNSGSSLPLSPNPSFIFLTSSPLPPPLSPPSPLLPPPFLPFFLGELGLGPSKLSLSSPLLHPYLGTERKRRKMSTSSSPHSPFLYSPSSPFSSSPTTTTTTSSLPSPSCHFCSFCMSGVTLTVLVFGEKNNEGWLFGFFGEESPFLYPIPFIYIEEGEISQVFYLILYHYYYPPKKTILN